MIASRLASNSSYPLSRTLSLARDVASPFCRCMTTLSPTHLPTVELVIIGVVQRQVHHVGMPLKTNTDRLSFQVVCAALAHISLDGLVAGHHGTYTNVHLVQSNSCSLTHVSSLQGSSCPLLLLLENSIRNDEVGAAFEFTTAQNVSFHARAR